MKLGFCSNAFTATTLETAIVEIAQLGYRGVELLCDAPHFWPESETLSRSSSLAQRLADHGISASNVNANTATGAYGASIPENVFGPSLASGDESVREFRQRHVAAAMQLAADVGAPCVSITSGYVEADLPPETALGHFRRSLDALLPIADDLGIDLGIEAEPGLLLESTAQAATFVRTIGHPRLGLNLDVGHAVVCGEDPATMIRQHADLLWHLHLEDIRDGVHYHRIPGEGDVDFPAIARALREVGFARFASVEVYPYKKDPIAAARRSIEVLGPLFD